ncbi:MAG TPA: hypothetical protein VH877_15425 [Polyangia bacterium]|jgi:hypothetical protein|nr:hypothetical protein [Polyangia bacterium]
MSAMRARRLDQRLRKMPSPVVPILKEVFGVERPRWILEPSLAVQRLFWERCGADFVPPAQIHLVAGWVATEQLRDLHGRVIPGLEAAPGEAALFFIDLEPQANWGHPCEYVLIGRDGNITRARYHWPPARHELIALKRPPGISIHP